MADVRILQNKNDGSLWADLPGGQLQPVTQEQAALIRENPGGVANILGSAVETGKQALLGLASFGPDAELAQAPLQKSREETQARGMVSPISTMAGQAVPALAVGAATQGAGIPAMMGAEALYGAAMSPEEPLVGAAVGAGAAGLAGAAGALVPRAVGALRGQAGRMSDRVLGRMDEADASAFQGPPAPRVLHGTMTAQDVEATGARLAPYQRAALDATNEGQFARAENMRWQARMAGNDFPEELASQRYAFTNMVKGELGLAGPENLTPRMVAEGLGREGRMIGQFRTAQGDIALPEASIQAMQRVAGEASSTHASALSNIVSDLQNSMSKNDGAVLPNDMNSAIKRLSTLSAPGGDPARIADAKAILKELEQSIEKKLNPAELIQYKQAMYRYKILKAMDKAGAVSADGTVNPVSFGRHWDKATAQTLRGSDTLGKAADTFAAINVIREHPGSTMQRVMAKAPGYAARAAPGAVGAALGVPLLGGLGGL